MKHLIIVLLILTAISLRVHYQMDKGLWIDEAKTANLEPFQGGGRELVQVLYYNLVGADTEFELRLPVILGSSLTILAFYLAFGWRAIPFMIMIAIHPYFIHWGSLARPYALAGLFVVLGAKNKWFYLPAVLVTPFAVTGLYLTKDRTIFYICLLLGAVVWYMNMPLSGSDHFNWEFLTNAKRLWYIPVVGLCANLCGAIDQLPGLRKAFQRLD